MASENRIDARFAKLREEGGTALVPFLTAGDPDLETTEALILAMAEAGADVIEIGVPFSDPTAEGPTIQRSSSRALESGTSLRAILLMVDRLRDQVEQPLVLMGYANPVHAMGAEGFAKAAADVGVDTGRLVVGAGHDALILAEHVPMTMLLIRSPDGISHHPDENITHADAVAGAQVLLRTVEKIGGLNQ